MTTTYPVVAQPYRLDAMSDAAIRESLFEIMSLLVRDKDETWLHKTKKQLLEIFNQWKAEHGCRNPQARRGVRGLRKYRPIAFEDAAPYECVDPANGVTDYVTLFSYLAQCDYPPVVAMLESEYIQDVVAVSAFIEQESVQLNSLLFELRIAFNTLIRHESQLERWRQILVDAAPTLRSHATTKKNLAAGRSKGAQEKKDRANELHLAWRQAAIDYLKRFPSKTLENTAQYIEGNGSLNPMKRACSTIRDVIAGCDKEALIQLSEIEKTKLA